MGFGGSIYTTETGKCYRLELLYHHPSKNWLLNFYQHTTQQRSYVTGMKTERSRITLVKAGVASPHQTLPQSRRMRFVPALNAVSLSDKPQRRHRKEKVFAPDKQASFLCSPKFHDKYKSQYSQSWPAFQPIRVSWFILVGVERWGQAKEKQMFIAERNLVFNLEVSKSSELPGNIFKITTSCPYT